MISGLIKSENVIVNLESSDKDSLFAEMVESLVRTNPELDRNELYNALQKREESGNTCVMKGVAVPHASCACVPKPLVAIGISGPGVDYDIEGVGTKDFGDSLVHIVFMLLFQQGNTNLHLRVLADCARVLHIPGFYKSLLSAGTPQDVCNLIREFESEF